MKRKISIVAISFFLLAGQASAFTYVNPDAFKPWYQRWYERFAECDVWVPCYFRERLGAFTQLNSTDRQVDFPTTYNNNLNITMEQGTTTVDSITTLSNLSTVGTITTGVWNGTTIGVLYGGTGTTSPSPFQILLGSTTPGSLDIVNGFGASGQFLTSNGADAKPSWTTSSFDQSIERDFTGDFSAHASTTWNTATEAASSFFGKLFFAGVGTTTLDFSGTAANTASSTFMGTDANGAVSNIPYSYLIKNTNVDTTSSTATTTQITVDIPANHLRGGGVVHIRADVAFDIGVFSSGNDSFTLNLLFGNTLLASTSIPKAGASLSDGVYYGTLEIFLSESGANSQEGWFSGTLRGTGTISATTQQMFAIGAEEVKSASENTTQTQTLRLDTIEGDTDMLFTVRSYFAELIR